MHPNIWYPYTQAKTAPDPIEVKSAQGLWLELADGRKIADCISSWWVNLHGHAHPQIVAAIARQAAQLEHVIFAGFTHAPAQELASQLVARLPEKLTRVFYSDNGSTAVEVALKMAYQYWANVGEPRDRFLSFEGAYHGDTAVCGFMGYSYLQKPHSERGREFKVSSICLRTAVCLGQWRLVLDRSFPMCLKIYYLQSISVPILILMMEI